MGLLRFFLILESRQAEGTEEAGVGDEQINMLRKSELAYCPFQSFMSGHLYLQYPPNPPYWLTTW